MLVILDTHALLWSLFDPQCLSPAARSAISAPRNTVHFSQVSLLEIQIKTDLGKLSMDIAPAALPAKAEEAGLVFLPLSNRAIFALSRLPPLHRDPFDRLLISETLVNHATLITCDPAVRKYPVRSVW